MTDTHQPPPDRAPDSPSWLPDLWPDTHDLSRAVAAARAVREAAAEDIRRRYADRDGPVVMSPTGWPM